MRLSHLNKDYLLTYLLTYLLYFTSPSTLEEDGGGDSRQSRVAKSDLCLWQERQVTKLSQVVTRSTFSSKRRMS